MKTILIIEDDPVILYYLLETLTSEGYHAVGTAVPSEGVQLAVEARPDLILCDIMMNGLDGYQVLEMLRQHPLTQNIPFIFLTAKTDRADMRKGMELGADDYITKPFTRAELLRAIETRFSKTSSMVDKYQKQLEELKGTIALSLPDDLRSPLSAILGFSHIVLSQLDTAPLEETRELVLEIKKAGERLNRLIENALLYSDLVTPPEHGEAADAVPETPVSSRAIIAAVAMDKAKEYHREADLKLCIRDATVKMAESELKKILIEALDNAFRFSKSGTRVRVTSKPRFDGLFIYVTDSGNGMKPERLQSVINVSSAQVRRKRSYEHGLGLQIVKLLVKKNRGRLFMKSCLGKGTTVQISLAKI